MSDPAKRVVILLALISLLVAVAVASTGSVPVGTGGTRSPSDRFLDVAISLFLLWMAFGTVLLVLLIVNRRGVLAQAVVERRKGGRRNALVAGAHQLRPPRALHPLALDGREQRSDAPRSLPARVAAGEPRRLRARHRATSPSSRPALC